MREFDLSDVPLFVTTASGDNLHTVNPFQGGIVTRVDNNLAANTELVQDIVMRSDGDFFAYQRLDNTATQTQAERSVKDSTAATRPSKIRSNPQIWFCFLVCSTIVSILL